MMGELNLLLQQVESFPYSIDSTKIINTKCIEEMSLRIDERS